MSSSEYWYQLYIGQEKLEDVDSDFITIRNTNNNKRVGHVREAIFRKIQKILNNNKKARKNIDDSYLRIYSPQADPSTFSDETSFRPQQKLSNLGISDEDVLIVVIPPEDSEVNENLGNRVSLSTNQEEQPFYVKVISKETSEGGDMKSRIESIVYDQTSSTTSEHVIVSFSRERSLFYGVAGIQHECVVDFTEEELALFSSSGDKQKLDTNRFTTYMKSYNTFSDKQHKIMCDIINSMDEISKERELFFRKNKGEMILQQSGYSIIASLFQHFARDGTMYSADQKVCFPYKLRAKISKENESDSSEEQNYSYTLSPDANIKMTVSHGSLGVMELKAGDKINHEDIFRMITMTMMTACGIAQHIKEQQNMTVEGTAADRNNDTVKMDIPFLFGNTNEAHLYTTRYNSEENPPIQVLRLKIVEYSKLEEIVHLLIVMLGRLQNFAKRNNLVRSIWDEFDDIATFKPSQINKKEKDQTKEERGENSNSEQSSSSGPPNKRQRKGTRKSQRKTKENAEFDENCARIVASCNGQISDLQYPWQRPAPLWLGEEGGDYSKCYQSRYPFYFTGCIFTQGSPKMLGMTSSPITSNIIPPSSSPTALDSDDDLKVDIPMSSPVCDSPKSSSQQVQVFCKVWLEGNKSTTRKSIQHEIDMLRLANENDIPSPHLIEELTCFDLTDSKVANKTYHVLTMTKVPNDKISQNDLFTFVKSFLDAVKKCHSAGILHCDIKPANIAWNSKAKTASLLDFGISQKVNGASNIGYTEGYGAPEIVEDGSCPTYESDVYSVGKTLMNMSEKCLKLSSCSNDFGERKESCIGNDIVEKMKDQVFMKLSDLSPTNRMNLEQAQNEVDKLTMNMM